jgi:UV DNA damage endonuclease
MRLVDRRNSITGKTEQVQTPPIWSGHADYINPFEFITFMRGAAGLPDFDVMFECKRKDLALLQLRKDLARYAPDVATRFFEDRTHGQDD